MRIGTLRMRSIFEDSREITLKVADKKGKVLREENQSLRRVIRIYTLLKIGGEEEKYESAKEGAIKNTIKGTNGEGKKNKETDLRRAVMRNIFPPVADFGSGKTGFAHIIHKSRK